MHGLSEAGTAPLRAAARPRPAAGSNPLTSDDAAQLLGPYLVGHGGSSVVLAVSGGPDSVALMRFAAALASSRAIAPVTVATVDHGLRPGSAEDAASVGFWAGECGFPHRVLVWSGPKPRTGLQEAARDARYSLLADLARAAGASHVLTAHHADDQAETVLMRLSRGSGPGGLGGMRPETPLYGVIVARPFLGIRKAALLAACRAQDWPFLSDPANGDPDFARTRFRRLLPHLEVEGLTPERLARLALRMRRWDAALKRSADRAFEAVARLDGRHVAVDGTALLREPEEIAVRVLSRAIGAVVGERHAPRLERLEELSGSLLAALRTGARFKANLGGALVEAGPDRGIAIGLEPPRASGRRHAARGDAAGVPHSLGIDSGHA